MDHPSSQQESPHQARTGAAPISKKSGVAIVAVLLVIAAIAAVWGIVPRVRARASLRAQTDVLAVPDVFVLSPQPGEPAAEVMLPGAITAFTDAPIYARTSGYLQKWYYDIGAHVRKGQLLAVISTPEADQQLLQAKADLVAAEANARNARQTSARYQDLLQSDAVSRQDTENFAAQASAMSAAVHAAEANVQRLEELKSFQRIYAPFDGVVTARNIDVGQLIDQGAGHELFHLSALHTLRVYVNVPQIYSRSARPGVVANLRLAEYPGRVFTGKLVRTANAIDPASRTLLAEIDVDNRKGELLPGAYAQVSFKAQAEGPSFIIPVTALIFRGEGVRVATVVDGDKARLVPVTLGRDDGRVVQVLGGLAPGARVIQDPPDSLIDGEIVHVVGAEGKRPGQVPANSAAPAGGARP